MSEVHIFNANDPDQIGRLRAEFITRCDLVLAQVFRKSWDIRQSFQEWVQHLVSESENPVWILHEHPLFIVAEYLGMDTSTIEASDSIAVEYGQLARKYNW